MKKKYSVLRCICLGLGIIEFLFLQIQENSIHYWKLQARKNRGLFLLMNQWMNIKQRGDNLKEYFIKNNYKRIAVYGMSHTGQQLLKELTNSGVEILYGIDRNADGIYSKVKLLTVNDDLPEVDAIVVTVIGEFEEIQDMLLAKVNCPIIAIEDVLNSI